MPRTEQADGIDEIVDPRGVALDGRLKCVLGHVPILGEAQPPLGAPLPPRDAAARAARPLVCADAAPCSNYFPLLNLPFSLFKLR